MWSLGPLGGLNRSPSSLEASKLRFTSQLRGNVFSPVSLRFDGRLGLAQQVPWRWRQRTTSLTLLCRIEKKRTVVPTLAAAVGDAEGRVVDWKYFYSLLFTLDNLKLVHVACHKKTTHRLRCDPSRIYRAQAVPRRKRPICRRR